MDVVCGIASRREVLKKREESEERGQQIHPGGRPADDGKRFSSDGRCILIFLAKQREEVWRRVGSGLCRIGGRRMTGSASKAMDVVY